jgi:hypothetical protein
MKQRMIYLPKTFTKRGYSDKDARSSVKDAARSAMSFDRNCPTNVETIGKPVELF